MLVLSRKVGEKVIVGDDDRIAVCVTVLSVRGHQVRLGFSAPDDVTIRREEICFDLPVSEGGDRRQEPCPPLMAVA